MRKKIVLAALVVFICLVSLGFQSGRDSQNARRISNSELQDVRFMEKNRLDLNRNKFMADQILVKFKPALSEAEINTIIAAYQTNKIKRIPKLDIYQLGVPDGFSVEEAVFAYRMNPNVEYAEPNYMAHASATPNDLLFRDQYALNNTGQTIGVPGSPTGSASADIKAAPAWEETKGSSDTLIAILDTGVQLLHPDLQAQTISGGRDFVNNDFDAEDDNGHGTHVAGIAAAQTNNSEGIAGVAWNCKILPVKVLDEDGSGSYSWIIDGIRWAADNGAHVINLSLGGTGDSDALRAALVYAVSQGVVCVAAAGNEGDAVLFPAAYDSCIAVAATNYNDERVTFENSIEGAWESNYGPEIDVAAPGERILSCVPTWFFGPGSIPYAYGFGTSASTPHVAGLAALITDLKPWLSVDQIMKVIQYTADDVNSGTDPGKDEYLGYGRINMEKALVPIKITSASN
ncbi:S8 family peptidase [Acidobacteriota bacterium]